MEVKTLCLGALALGDATGYEIKKMFEDGVFGHFLEASYGSIYPALTKLTEEGLLTCTAKEQDGKPDKKIYSITEEGGKALSGRLSAPLSEDKFRSDFLFVMVFAHFLPEAAVSRLIDDKIAGYRAEFERLESEKGLIGTPGAEFIRRFGRTVMRASAECLEANRHLIEGPLAGREEKEPADTFFR